MKQGNIFKIIVLSILFFTSLTTLGQLASYPLSANGTATGVDANITASAFIGNGVGTVTFGTSGAFASTWDVGPFNLGEYFEITLTPNSGFNMNITAINFSERRSATGPRDYQVRWSIDNFSNSTTIATVNVPDNISERDGSINELDIDVADGETLKIRWYGYNAEQSGGSWRINDGTLNLVGSASLATSNPLIGFSVATSSVNETNIDVVTAGIPITLINYVSNVTITPTVNGASTANPADYTIDLTPIVFDANETNSIPLTIHADADFYDETLIIDFTVTTGTADLGTSTHTVTIIDDDIRPNFEDFTNSNAKASYADNNFLGNNGITWTYVASRDENSDGNGAGINGKAIMLRKISDGSKVTSSTITGGIQNFSVKLYKGFTGGGSRQVELFINNVFFGTSSIFDNYTEQTFTVNNINITGNVVIELRNTTELQVIVDDITWASFNPATVTWDGSEGTDWATLANWDTNSVPTAGNNVVIADVTNKPLVGSSTIAETNDLTINGSAFVNISNNGTLRVYGTSSGNVTYKRTLGTENWYLVSSPVTGETYDNAHVAANSLAINGSNNAIGTYNDAAATGSKWSYMQTGGGATFTSGTGYTVRRATAAGAGDIYFTGTINTSDVPLTVATAGTGFNLIGNPYTAHLNSASFLTDNTSNLVSQTLWVFNQSSGNYETYVTSSAFMLAPTQGFFVRASATSLNIAESYQAITGGTFQKSAKTEVKLMMTDGTADRFAKVYYLDNATTSFDNGYDGETFGGISTTLDVFTQLVSNNVGKNFQLQSLPNSDYENLVVPVGVIANAGKEITFTTEAINLPSGINVYLEDKLTNTFTRLDEANSNYKVTLTENANGIGRFYLHTKSSALSVTDVTMNAISIYKTTNSTLRITGLSQGKASISMYNMLGKQVLNSDFTSNGVSDIALPKLATGIYIVHLATENGTLNKKITLE